MFVYILFLYNQITYYQSLFIYMNMENIKRQINYIQHQIAEFLSGLYQKQDYIQNVLFFNIQQTLKEIHYTFNTSTQKFNHLQSLYQSLRIKFNKGLQFLRSSVNKISKFNIVQTYDDSYFQKILSEKGRSVDSETICNSQQMKKLKQANLQYQCQIKWLEVEQSNLRQKLNLISQQNKNSNISINQIQQSVSVEINRIGQEKKNLNDKDFSATKQIEKLNIIIEELMKIIGNGQIFNKEEFFRISNYKLQNKKLVQLVEILKKKICCSVKNITKLHDQIQQLKSNFLRSNQIIDDKNKLIFNFTTEIKQIFQNNIVSNQNIPTKQFTPISSNIQKSILPKQQQYHNDQINYLIQTYKTEIHEINLKYGKNLNRYKIELTQQRMEQTTLLENLKSNIIICKVSDNGNTKLTGKIDETINLIQNCDVNIKQLTSKIQRRKVDIDILNQLNNISSKFDQQKYKIQSLIQNCTNQINNKMFETYHLQKNIFQSVLKQKDEQIINFNRCIKQLNQKYTIQISNLQIQLQNNQKKFNQHQVQYLSKINSLTHKIQILQKQKNNLSINYENYQLKSINTITYLNVEIKKYENTVGSLNQKIKDVDIQKASLINSYEEKIKNYIDQINQAKNSLNKNTIVIEQNHKKISQLEQERKIQADKNDNLRNQIDRLYLIINKVTCQNQQRDRKQLDNIFKNKQIQQLNEKMVIKQILIKNLTKKLGQIQNGHIQQLKKQHLVIQNLKQQISQAHLNLLELKHQLVIKEEQIKILKQQYDLKSQDKKKLQDKYQKLNIDYNRIHHENHQNKLKIGHYLLEFLVLQKFYNSNTSESTIVEFQILKQRLQEYQVQIDSLSQELNLQKQRYQHYIDQLKVKFILQQQARMKIEIAKKKIETQILILKNKQNKWKEKEKKYKNLIESNTFEINNLKQHINLLKIQLDEHYSKQNLIQSKFQTYPRKKQEIKIWTYTTVSQSSLNETDISNLNDLQQI